MKTPRRVRRQDAGERVAAVVLAGGRGSRMGGKAKILRSLGGLRLIDRAIARIAPQVGTVLVSSHLPLGELRAAGHPILEDALPAHAGPLAGVLSAMEHLLDGPSPPPWLCSIAADTPWFPMDLVAALQRESRGKDVVVAASGGRLHPVFALWSLRTASRLRELLVGEGERSVQGVQARLCRAVVDWPVGATDPFGNLNTLADLRRARARLARERG